MNPDPDFERPPLPSALVAQRLLVVLRGLSLDAVNEVARSLAAEGISIIEVTLDSPQALEAIAAVRAGLADTVTVGAGTIDSLAGAKLAVEAGANFLVAPHTDREVIKWAVEHGIPTLPGALTPTEIAEAWWAGASAVKIFPASAVGPSFLRALPGFLRNIPLIPTGGIDAENALSYLQSGATALGVGGWLIGDANSAGIAQRARELTDAIASS